MLLYLSDSRMFQIRSESALNPNNQAAWGGGARRVGAKGGAEERARPRGHAQTLHRPLAQVSKINPLQPSLPSLSGSCSVSVQPGSRKNTVRSVPLVQTHQWWARFSSDKGRDVRSRRAYTRGYAQTLHPLSLRSAVTTLFAWETDRGT